MASSSRSTRQTELVVAAVLLLVLLAIGGAALVFVSTINPVHRAAEVVSSRTAVAAEPDRRAIEQARNLVRAAMATGNIPGLSIAVTRGSDLAWSESFGFAEVEHREPLTPDIRFRVGAISKTLTAAAAGRVRDRGALDPDAPVQQYVKAYPPKAWPLTARHLMADTGGVHHLRGQQDRLPSSACSTLGDALQIFRDDPLAFQPGTRYRFSIYGWILLSAVIQGAAHEPFDAVMSRDVFEPLGMTRTTSDGAGVDGVAAGYFPRAAENPAFGLQDAPAADYSCFAGAGQYVSTAADLARFGAAMSAPGFLAPDTWSQWLEPARTETGVSTGVAFGWKVSEAGWLGRRTRVLTQRGTPMGATAVLLVLPEPRLAVAITSNVSYATGVDPLATAVAEAFGDGPPAR